MMSTAAMMSSDDDDEEPRLKAVENYYFVVDNDVPVSFAVLPFRFDAWDEALSGKEDAPKEVFLRGFADGGLQKVYKQVVAWKLGLDGKQPEIAVLSTDGSWIGLLKPRAIYEETVRTILITVQMLHFLRRKPMETEKNLWEHLRRVFDKFMVRPSNDDFKDHWSLIKLFAEKDPTLAKSQILRAFIEETHRKKIDEVSSNNMEIKQPFIADDEEIEEMVEDDSKLECNDNNDEEEEDEDEQDLFDSVCAICDNGGDLLCCEGPCMRSFHATMGDGDDSYCATLGYTAAAEVEAIQNFLCKNCKHKQHQCFVCGKLEPSDGPNAKVFLCNNATCGHFYHPKCVAQLLHADNRNEASELEKKIVAGFSFTCPVHWCFLCKGLEDRTQKPLQFAVCRRCPRSYHRKCLPREISFDDIEEEDIITRAWELSKRILIYCLDHDIDFDIGTPSRDHIKFPYFPEIKKPADNTKNKVKVLAREKKRTFDDSYVDQPSEKLAMLSGKFSMKERLQTREVGMKNSSEQLVLKPEKKKVKRLKETAEPEPSLVEGSNTISGKKPVKEQEKQLELTTGKPPQSSFPVVDGETEKRVIALVDTEMSSLTLEDVSKKCIIPSTHVCSGRQLDKIIARGKLERSVQAVQAALQKLENGGTVDDAKAVCEPEVLRQLARWNSKFKVYLAPFIHGMRYTSFGRHFTKKEKLIEIVNKLHWYVQPGDTIVDFCCGTNDFSQLMKEKLDKVGKMCNFKNYDVIQPKNSFSFEKRDWMTVRLKELPQGSKLIMGLNPPFGVKATLANKFVDKALTFKPKLIILIAPKETERLDRKRVPYDLVWEDDQSLSGKSFYLPGSVDVNDRQMDQWNVSPPPLFLWSRTDWTEKHRKIAEKLDHTDVGKIASHAVEGDNLLDDLLVQKREAACEQNSRSVREKDTRRENRNHNARSRTPEQVDGFPPEKQVEVAYEERKVVCREDQSDFHYEGRDFHCDTESAWPNDNRKAVEVSNSRFRERRESKKVVVIDAKADSDMSISSSDTRNAQIKSRSYSRPIPSESEHPLEGMAHQNDYFSHPLSGSHASPCEMAPYQDSYFRTMDEHGAAPIGNHNFTFSTENVGDGSSRYGPNLEELTKRYAADPTGDVHNLPACGAGSSYYRRHSSEDCIVDYTMEGTDTAMRNSVSNRDVREHVRMYGGHRDDHPQRGMIAPSMDVREHVRMYGRHIRDNHLQTGMTLPSMDARAHVRMYGGQNAYDYSFESSDARFGHPSIISPSHGMPPMSATLKSATDKYLPRLDETNYTTGGPRDPYDAPGYRRDMPPDPRSFASRQNFTSGGWCNN